MGDIAAEVGGVLGNTPDPAHIPDKLTYFYIKNVKKWMECPVCGEKLRFNEDSEAWECESCDFVLPEAEFLDGYIFWFCDECDAFLNVQEGFDKDGTSWTCFECGHENDLTIDGIVGTCRECGAILEDPQASFCPDCEAERLHRSDD